eukprot:s50_g29.t1
MTGFERATGRHYSGKLACFGETILAFVRTSQKGLPQWRRGIWLSESSNNDCHIVASGHGLYVTRSIRRLPDSESYQLEPLGEITAAPWEYGYASLGHRLVYSKRSSLPPAVGIGSALKLDDKDAMAVRKYARAHPFEDADPQAISAEAGKLYESGAAEDAADGGDVLDDTPIEAMMSPAKEAKHNEPGSVNLLGRILKLEHMEIEPNVDMSTDDVDFMVEHELSLDENPYEAVDEMAERLKQLSFPYPPQEPAVDPMELQRLDAIADQLEIERLTGLQVFCAAADWWPVNTVGYNLTGKHCFPQRLQT